MSPDDTTILALGNSFTVTALALLVQCLEHRGAIEPGEYARVVRETIEADGADRERLDYILFAQLLRRLEGIEDTVN